MQSGHDVDECVPSQDSLVNNVESFMKLEPGKENEGTASATTDSTDPTGSYEDTEDTTSVDGRNVAPESDVLPLHDGHSDAAKLGKSGSEIVDALPDKSTTSCNSDADESTKTLKVRIKKLRWGIIEMRLHPVIPGDHPDTREGPPITMDWEILSEQKMDIDGYEAKRPTRLKVLGYDLRMGSMDRLNLLRRGGVREEDINSAMESASITRKQRLRTSDAWRRQFGAVEEIKESILRKLSKAMNPERRKKLITRY